MGTLDQFPEHRRVLDAVVAAYRDDPRVTGVLLGGSNVAGGMDGYSDVDLDVVVADAAFDAVFAERDRVVAAAGRPLYRFFADVPGSDHLYVVLYDTPAGPVKLDVEYHRAGEQQARRPGYDHARQQQQAGGQGVRRRDAPAADA